jgi:hypothetical protein
MNRYKILHNVMGYVKSQDGDILVEKCKGYWIFLHCHGYAHMIRVGKCISRVDCTNTCERLLDHLKSGRNVFDVWNTFLHMPVAIVATYNGNIFHRVIVDSTWII